MKKAKPLLLSLLLSLGTGGLSALLTRDAMEEYGRIMQPPLAPPGWVFPVVWTVLFGLMGYSAYLVWRTDAPARRPALILYAAQLVANVIWSLLFFNGRLYLAAFFWLLLLETLIGAMILTFRRVSRTAALLQLPYFLWVLFAGYLNLGVWALNG